MRNRPQPSDEGLPPSPKSDSKKTEGRDPKHDREDEKGGPLLDRKGDTIVFSEPQPNEDADAEDDPGDEHHHDRGGQDEREEVLNDRIGDRGSVLLARGRKTIPANIRPKRHHEPRGEPEGHERRIETDDKGRDASEWDAHASNDFVEAVYGDASQ